MGRSIWNIHCWQEQTGKLEDDWHHPTTSVIFSFILGLGILLHLQPQSQRSNFVYKRRCGSVTFIDVTPPTTACERSTQGSEVKLDVHLWRVDHFYMFFLFLNNTFGSAAMTYLSQRPFSLGFPWYKWTINHLPAEIYGADFTHAGSASEPMLSAKVRLWILYTELLWAGGPVYSQGCHLMNCHISLKNPARGSLGFFCGKKKKLALLIKTATSASLRTKGIMGIF